MPKRNAFLFLGPAIEGADHLHEALRDDPVLDAAAVAVPDVSSDDLHRADLEIRRLHKAAGLRRQDVEGSWARVCRKALKARSDVVICQPDWLSASVEQAALVADGLTGLRLHVVVTPPAEPLDLDSYLGPWAGLVGRKGGTHALPVGRGLDAADLAQAVALLALEIDRVSVERKLARLEKRRRRVGRRMARSKHPAA